MSITEHPKINEWLTLVEKEMRVTLAKLLAESVTEVEIFGKATSIDPNTYITWIDKYQVTWCRCGVRCGGGSRLSANTASWTMCLLSSRPSLWSCRPR